MPKTKIVVEFFIPTTSTARAADCTADIVGAVNKHRGENLFVTMSGPYPDQFSTAEGIQNGEGTGKGSGSADVGRAGDGRSAAAARAFDGDDGRDVATVSDDGDKPKRGRGRPPKAGAASGKPDERKPSGGGAEGSKRTEPVGAGQDAGEGAGEGEGRSGRDRGSRDDQRGNREAARVSNGDEDLPRDDDDGGDEWSDDWSDDTAATEDDDEEFHAKSEGDAWPDSLTPADVDKTVLSTLLGDHYKAAGGKDRAITFELMEKVTGERQLGQVPEKQYRKLAKALLKDAARYRHGLKKAK